MLKGQNRILGLLLILFIASGCQQNPNEKQNNPESRDRMEESGENATPEESGPSRISISDITDSELQGHMEMQADVRELNARAQDSIMTALEEGNLDVQRFQEIGAVAQNPSTNTDVSRAELENFKTVYAEVEEIRKNLDKRIEERLEEAGITRERYGEISDALEMSPELQQRARNLPNDSIN